MADMLNLFDGPAGTAAAPPAPDVFERARCRNHARVPSAGRCESCLAPICQVCRFSWPGERHFCPACATAPRDHLIAARKRYIAWSLALAGWNSFGLMLLLVVGAAGGAEDGAAVALLGFGVIVLCVMPGVVGFALALAARGIATGAARTSSSAVPIAWNAVLLGLWFLFMVMGILEE